MSSTHLIRLSPSVTVRCINCNEVKLISKQVRLSFASPGAESFLQRLVEGVVLDEDFIRVCNLQEIRLLRLLQERGLLTSELSNPFFGEVFEKQYGYWSTASPLPSQLQRSITEKKIAILGVGGVGATVLSHLVGAGVHRFFLVDSDIVERSNLNRQFIFHAGQLGQAKVLAAAAYIRQRVPHAEVKCSRSEIASVADMDATFGGVQADLLVCAADRPSDIDIIVSTYCVAQALPYVSCGVSLYGGYVEAHSHPKSVHQAEAEREGRIMAGGTYSHGPTNTIVSAYAAHAVLSCLSDSGLRTAGRRVYVDVEGQADLILKQKEVSSDEKEHQ